MKTPIWIATAALIALAACSSEAAEQPTEQPTDEPSEAPAPAPAAESAEEEPLPTPEEEAAKAEQAIDEANADAELQRLQEELGDG